MNTPNDIQYYWFLWFPWFFFIERGGWEDMKAVAWHRATPPHGVVLYGVKV